MKRLIVRLLLPVFAAALLCSCAGPAVPSGASGSGGQLQGAPEAQGPVSAPSDREALLALLERQVYLYERGDYGVPYQTPDAEDYLRWGWAGVFAEEMGVPYGREGGRQELLALMCDAWFGVDVTEDENHYFSDSGPSLEPLALSVKQAEIGEDEAVLVVSRVRGGIPLMDAEYTFRRAGAGDEVLGSLAAELTLDGSLWRYQKVEALEDIPAVQPVVISTEEELIDLCRRVNDREPEAVYGHFVLGGDIKLTDRNWEPMGQSFPDEDWNSGYAMAKVLGGFNGTFDGQNHTVSGVVVTGRPPEGETGFFGRLGPRAVVKDLTVEGTVDDLAADGTMNYSTGGFAGMICSGAQVTNCHFRGTVSGYCYAGGFAGRIMDPSFTGRAPAVVSGCSAEVAMKASYYGGGFAGYTEGEVSDCQAQGLLTIVNNGEGLPHTIGGFAGSVSRTLSRCSSAVRVAYDVPGANRMGSFAGELGECDLLGCVIHPDAVHQGWYLVGFQAFRNRNIEVEREAWCRIEAPKLEPETDKPAQAA